MQVTVTKITDFDLLREAAETTVRNDCGKLSPLAMYMAEHSPIRTQLFKISMDNIPVAYSTHFLRHNQGLSQYALTHRPDRGGDGDVVVHRLTPTKHLMIANAQALINMARVRICHKAHETTRQIMRMIHEGVAAVDDELSRAMRPNCYYHGGICYEPKCCRKAKGVVHWKDAEAHVWTWRWDDPLEQMAKGGGAA